MTGELVGWVERIRRRVSEIRDVPAALAEVLPALYAEAYEAGLRRGRAEGRVVASRGFANTLESLRAAALSPEVLCPACAGRGVVEADDCPSCAGSGRFVAGPDPRAKLT